MNTLCRNLLAVAEEAVISHQNLKKVVILNHTPRFDNIKNKNLSEKANAILFKLCEKSKLKGKITIGSHNLEDFGIGHTHNGRYGSPYDSSYDGVHYMGPSGSSEYTRSLITAILHELPELSNSKSSRVSDPFPLRNRFLPLQEGNC